MELNESGLNWLKERDLELIKEIIVARVHNGKLAVIESLYGYYTLTALNSPEFNTEARDDGFTFPKIYGVKPVTEERTLESVTKHFTDQFGVDNVYSMSVK